MMSFNTCCCKSTSEKKYCVHCEMRKFEKEMRLQIMSRKLADEIVYQDCATRMEAQLQYYISLWALDVRQRFTNLGFWEWYAMKMMIYCRNGVIDISEMADGLAYNYECDSVMPYWDDL